jgi:hypothetical protein
MVGRGGVKTRAPRLAIADQTGNHQALDLPMNRGQRNLEPICQVGGRVLLVRMEIEPGEDVGLVAGPEEWPEIRSPTTH